MVSGDKYGVRDQTSISDEIDLYAEELTRNGYTIVPSGFSQIAIQNIGNAFETHRHSYFRKFGFEYLETLNEQHTLRAPFMQGNKIFLDVAFHPQLLDLVSRMIQGEFYLNQQNGVINPGGAPYSQGRWHRDLPYQHWVNSRPLAINALYCIDDFTSDNGATLVIPGSHKFAEFPSDAFAEKHAIQVSAKAGDFIVLDCMTYHSGAHNSTYRDRRGLNHVYSIPLLAPQISTVESVDQLDLTPEQLKLLGLRYRVPRSVEDYFQKS